MNDIWAMDFMSDRLFDEKPFRILTIVDCYTREALAIAARTNFRAYQVVDELDRLLDQWVYLNKVGLDFSRPRKPTDNAYIKALNSQHRQECLNSSWFLSMGDTQTRINSCRTDYNETKPHSSLGNLTQSEFVAQLNETRKLARSPDQKCG